MPWMQCEGWIQTNPVWADSECGLAPPANSGGYGDSGSGHIPSGRRRDPDELRRQREDLGIIPKAKKVIDEVAARQVERLEIDEQKRFDELRGELQLLGIELETAHLEALNLQREQLISAEIAARIAQKMRNDQTMALLLMAAAI